MHFACFRPHTDDEQHILIHLHIRLVTPEETSRFEQLIIEHHYLKNARVAGEHPLYVVSYRGATPHLPATAG